jgi:hypothetical protein
MPETPANLQHAARAAALRVEKLLVEMLANHELGEVAVVVSWGQLEPEKRVVQKARVIKVGRGHFETVEKVP